MSKLFLFTNHFPHGQGEVFLETELVFTSQFFKEVIIIPLAPTQPKSTRILPVNVSVSKPLLNCRLDQKLRLLLSGTLNRAPLRFALMEFISQRVITRMQWIKNWMSYTCITRAALASDGYRKLLKNINPEDLLYFYWGDNASNLVRFLKSRLSNKMLVRFHGSDLYKERKGGYLPYRKQLLENIDLALMISAHGKEYLAHHYPMQNHKVAVSRLGVMDKGLAKKGTHHILNLVSCSSLVKVKRVHLIAEALKLIDFEVNWVHFGTGPLLDEIEGVIRKLPAKIHVQLMGQTSNAELIDFYSHNPVDLFINVSESEGIPVSIMEAASMGVPALATNVGGVSEIVSEENGFLIDKDSSPEVIAKYISYFYHRSDQEKLRLNSRLMWSQRFDAQKNYTSLGILISSMVSGER